MASFNTNNRKISVFQTSQGIVRVGSRQLRILRAVADFTEDGVLPAKVWRNWGRLGGAPQWSTTADVFVALLDKGLVEPTDNGLFDLFEARLLPDYRITALGREVLA